MEDSSESVEKSLNFMQELSRVPEQLFEHNEILSSKIKLILKDLYDFSKNQEIKSSKSNSLPELIIQNFDNEQIWQQLELQNNTVLENSIVNVSNLLLKKDRLVFKNFEKVINEPNEKNDDISSDVNDNFEASASEEEKDESELEEMEAEEEEEEVLEHENDEVPLNIQSSNKKSIVDDDFFKLHEMEEFLNSEEKKMNPDSGNEQDLEESDDSEESVDLFAQDSEDSEDGKVRLAKYKEFFVSKQEEPKLKRNKYLEEFPEEDESESKSTLELRQNRLQQKIGEIETKAVSEKPWQLQGEIKGDSRPYNSLLEEIVEFDRTSRPAPIITGQTTLQLEDIIRQRIKDRVFDSVERKVKPTETPLEYKKKLVLDQEKSKASLAQIYEKEYLDQQAALDPENTEKEEKEPELHKEIRLIMKTLFEQLDALSNFHYTPRPAIPELKIISNIPAINMEEVAPVATSDAALLAPEEVRTKPKAEILGKSERTTSDKNRERRKKKLKQRHHAREKAKREKILQKINPGMGNKYSKEKARKLLEKISKDSNVEKMEESSGSKAMKSSTAFFNQLQEQVHSQIKSKSEPKNKKNKLVHDAKKMKL